MQTRLSEGGMVMTSLDSSCGSSTHAAECKETGVIVATPTPDEVA